MTRFLLPALFFVAVAAAGAATAPGSLEGRWLTQDTRAIVEVAPCGAQDCGTIVWIKDPIDLKSGKPRHDKHNPVVSLQQRPIIGLLTLNKIVPNTQGSWNAVSYDPRDGETHEITIRIGASGNKIELKGCVLGGLICDSEIWTRAPAAPIDPSQQQTAN